jgi:hypothetical protein
MHPAGRQLLEPASFCPLMGRRDAAQGPRGRVGWWSMLLSGDPCPVAQACLQPLNFNSESKKRTNYERRPKLSPPRPP